MVVYTVAEDRLRRRIGHAEHKGERNGTPKGLAQGMEQQRKLLRRLVARGFGPKKATCLAPLLADNHDTEGLEQVGEWIVDWANGEELIAQFGGGLDRRRSLTARSELGRRHIRARGNSPTHEIRPQ